jgi:hypothetical protein
MIILFIEYIGSIKLEEQKQIIWLISGTILSLTYIIYRYKWYKKMTPWTFNNNILTRGSPSNLVCNLTDIEVIIIGLPTQRWLSFFFKTPVKEIKILEALHSSTITMKFRNGAYLPLYLFDLDNGLDITNEILNQFKNKIDEKYIFTDFEKKILKPKNHNKLLNL